MSIMLYYKDDFEAEVTPITREGTDHMRKLLAAFLKKSGLTTENCISLIVTWLLNYSLHLGWKPSLLIFLNPKKTSLIPLKSTS